MKAAEVDVVDVTKGITMNVRLVGVRRFQRRVRLATWLIRLACRVLGVKVNVAVE